MSYLRFLLGSGHLVGWVLGVIAIVLLPTDLGVKAMLAAGLTLLLLLASALQFRSNTTSEPRWRRRARRRSNRS
jgi:hypothetical protein